MTAPLAITLSIAVGVACIASHYAALFCIALLALKLLSLHRRGLLRQRPAQVVVVLPRALLNVDTPTLRRRAARDLNGVN